MVNLQLRANLDISEESCTITHIMDIELKRFLYQEAQENRHDKAFLRFNEEWYSLKKDPNSITPSTSANLIKINVDFNFLCSRVFYTEGFRY